MQSARWERSIPNSKSLRLIDITGVHRTTTPPPTPTSTSTAATAAIAATAATAATNATSATNATAITATITSTSSSTSIVASCYFMLLLLVIVQRAACSTGCYKRANIFTTDRGRSRFACGNSGEQIILSATHIIIRYEYTHYIISYYIISS